MTFTATVAIASPGAGTPTGSVSFSDGTTSLGTAPLTGGKAVFSTSSLAVGSHNIKATYGGDANFLASPSNVTLLVGKAATTTTLASAANPAVFGQSVVFTATVAAAAGAATPTGSVQFMDGTTSLGSAPLAGGTATFGTTALAVASHRVTAVYAGDASSVASTSAPLTQTVNKAATTVSVTSARPNPSTFGQAVTLTATVAAVSPGAPGTPDLGAPTGSVTFVNAATHATLGTATLQGNTATISTALLAAGQHNITATYAGNANFNAGSSPATGLVQNVQQAATTTSLAAAASIASTVGQSVTFIASVAVAAPGAGTPTGSVSFVDANTNTTLGSIRSPTARPSSAPRRWPPASTASPRSSWAIPISSPARPAHG